MKKEAVSEPLILHYEAVCSADVVNEMSWEINLGILELLIFFPVNHKTLNYACVRKTWLSYWFCVEKFFHATVFGIWIISVDDITVARIIQYQTSYKSQEGCVLNVRVIVMIMIMIVFVFPLAHRGKNRNWKWSPLYLKSYLQWLKTYAVENVYIHTFNTKSINRVRICMYLKNM